MGDMTTIREVLEFAIAREAEAVHYYLKMAQQANNSSTVQFFEELVSEELEHKSLLELELMKEGIVTKSVGVVQETFEKDNINKPAQTAKQMDYAEAVNMAIRKERRSFKLYVRLAGLVEDDTLRETLVSLAEEEAKHLVTLEEHYKKENTEKQ